MSLDPVETAVKLVRIPSVTDTSNAGVTQELATQLAGLGFEVRVRDYQDFHGTSKQLLEAKRAPESSSPERQSTADPLAYFCHTDVVSVDGWDEVHGGPFDANIRDGRLWGRGSCDMKGSIASMLSAISRIDASEQTAAIYFFMTGDEENGMVGADRLAQDSQWFGEACESGALGIIGEPTSLSTVNAHKGGCHINVSAQGVAAHSSTNDGVNANWQMIPFLTALKELVARTESEPQYQNKLFDPSTLSLNVVLHNRPAMANITVGESTCEIFFRPMPDTQWQSVADEILAIAKTHKLDAKTLRPLSPVFTPSDAPCVQKFNAAVGRSETSAVCFATDGCCLTQLKNLIVFGPGSIEQAHRPDEWIAIEQLQLGADMFERALRKFVTNN